jgi:hypothetical protein
MRDGSRYTGEFKNGEMTGEGFKQWADGRVYKTYQGEFQFNSREGQGVLTKKNGDVYEGTF